MTTGELWVAHPLFPWIMIILAWWVGCSTAVMVRNWVRICKLERHNKLLQEMLVEGVGSIARRVTAAEIFASEGERRLRERRIRSEEPEPAAIEEAENGDYIAVDENKDTAGTGIRST